MNFYKRILLTLVMTCLFSFTLMAQSVTMKLKNVSVKQAISEVKAKTGYSFVYEVGDIDTSKVVDIDGSSLQTIISQILNGQSVSFEIKGTNIIVKKIQNIAVSSDVILKVKGQVKDAIGEPIIGATIMEVGSTNGTITDIDGNFVLDVTSSGKLKFSYVGYIDYEVSVGNKRNFVIVLKEDNQLLDEVVVVGFGSQKKVNLTGAVTTMSGDSFEGRPVQNATMMLQGAVPGLNVGAGTGDLGVSPSINIRGLATIGKGSSGSPLVLIDGMEGDLNMLNPQDIENISVLKDAAAASIYGSRAPFGVILVTTKSGKQDKLTVNYNNSFRWNTPTKRPETVDSYRFATYFNDAAANGNGVGKFSPERMQRIKDHMDEKLTTVNIPDPNNPLVWADGYDYGNANVDWYDEIYKKWSFAQEHTASVNGGSGRIQMYASFNYMGAGGMIKAVQDKFDRYATNLKVNSELTNYLRLSYNMKYSRSDYDRPSQLRQIDRLGYQTWPMLPIYDDNGYLFNSPSPLIAIREGGRAKTRKDVMTQQLQANVTILPGWEVNGGISYAINRNRDHSDTQKFYNHNVAGEVIPNANSTNVYEHSHSNDYMNINLYSTYSREVGKGHNFKFMLGFQSENSFNNQFSASRDGIIVPGMDVIDITEGTDGSGAIVPPSVVGFKTEWGVIGFFGRVNYNYKERYLFEFNLRHDGSSRFRRDNRWKTFPSVSLGWNIAREDFWDSIADKISTFKLRASYGILGNQNTSSLYPTFITIPIGTANGGWLIDGKRPNTANAPGLISSSLTWEIVKSFNVGFDIVALDNRLNFNFDWYQRKTNDMVGPAPELPEILGTDVPTTNNTDLRTRGWEVAINWRDNINKDWSYQVGFNLSDAQTVITNYPNETNSLDEYYSGQIVGEIWGYQTLGIAKTQEEMDAHLATLPNGGQNALGSQWGAGDIMYKDLSGDGSINGGSNSLYDHGDKKVIGNNTPRFRFGLNLGASWRGLDFSMFFQGVMKRDFWEGSWNFWGFSGDVWRSTGYKQHMDYFRDSPNHYMGMNTNSYYPRPVEGSSKNLQVQTRYLQNAAYIRLKNAQLGYTLPKRVLNKLHLGNLRVYISGENLWTGTSLSSLFDPEALGYGSGSIGYPINRTLSAGISITL